MNDESHAPAVETPRLRSRKRQTYKRRYQHLARLWNKQFRVHAMRIGYQLALGHARREAIKAGDTETPTEPHDHLIDWYQRLVVRDYKADVRANTDWVMGWDAKGWKRSQWRNSKLGKSAETWQNGDDRSTLYDTTRKLMSPEDRAAHDRKKRTEAQRKRREEKRAREKAARSPMADHPNYARF